MSKKSLKKLITKKLTELETILEEIRNFIIETDDPEMWDSDYYYDLAKQLKEALILLEDNQQTAEYGIYSLIEEYSAENEED